MIKDNGSLDHFIEVDLNSIGGSGTNFLETGSESFVNLILTLVLEARRTSRQEMEQSLDPPLERRGDEDLASPMAVSLPHLPQGR